MTLLQQRLARVVKGGKAGAVYQARATEVWKKLLLIDPKQADALYGLGMLELKGKRLDGASNYLGQLRRAHPGERPTLLLEQAIAVQAQNPQVRMIEIKMSQGAKPGHGGILPKHKVTQEIAETRGILMGEDCISPSRHSAFSTPIELMQFIAQLRELSGGKPVGFKFCLGHPWEFMGIAKAMLETGILPDFIVVDGKEGGTGAAPVEFTDHIGVPLREGLPDWCDYLAAERRLYYRRS